jgi:plastocyanin
MRLPVRHRRCLGLFLFCGCLAYGQGVTLTARVALVNADKGRNAHPSSNVVVWLAPAGTTEGSASQTAAFPAHPRLVQKNKSFDPHVLVVPVGSVVQFPNQDPFFHNVFSLFEGKRFDLGLYEAGSTREVHFDKPGISYIFCNIHAEMSAVVIALDTPYYGISDKQGQIVIPHVPPGHYWMRLWYEEALPETLNGMAREVTVLEGSSTLGVLRLTAATLPPGHKNKYGREYNPPTPASPAYARP